MDTADPSPPEIFGLQNKLNEILERIQETQTSVIGISGPCGIGKTTLLREIEKKFRDNDGKPIAPYTTVMFIRVTKTLDFDRIQKKIAGNLKLVDNREKNFNGLSITERAEILSCALSRETFLMMLDDLWESLNFQKIGIPPFKECKSGSKILISTRLKRVCWRPHPTTTVDMKYLNESDSTQLFTAACANEKIRNGDIAEKIVAQKIIMKCAGLPLALITLGEGSRGRYLPRIYECLSISPQDITGMEKNLLKKVRDSFDALEDEIKPCFLFCVLFQDFKDISRKQLVDYWIGEELVSDDNLNEAHDFLARLLGCYLLEEAPDADNVKIHNIVRSTAVWLAKESPNNKHGFQFYAKEKFDKSALEKMERLKRASVVDSDIDINEVLKCNPVYPCLETLLMGLSKTRPQSTIHIETGCFIEVKKSFIKIFEERSTRMPCIRVLDLANRPITNFPRSVYCLKFLRYLNLSYTLIERLPAELGELTRLIQLDLTGTLKLVSIPCKANSSFSNMKSMKLYDSTYRKINNKGELGLKHLQAMSYLAELQLSLQDLETLKSLSECTKLSNVTTYLQLSFFSLNINEMSKILPKFVNLEVLSIKSCLFTTVKHPIKSVSDNEAAQSFTSFPFINEEIRIHLDDVPKLQIIVLQNQNYLPKLSIVSPLGLQKPSLLRKLHISFCSKLTSITCLCLLQNLEILEIKTCEEIVELLSLPSQPSATNPFRHEDHTKCLTKLKSLKLEVLSKLENISHCNLSSKSLEIITVSKCENLKKLHFNPLSGGRQIKVYCEEMWWTALEWNDGVTEPTFHPWFQE